MGKIDVIMPQLGESLTEGTIIKWHKKVGESIKKDETLLEISTDKVDSEIPSPASGIITKLFFKEQETIAVKTKIAEIETEAGKAVIEEKEVEEKIPLKEEIITEIKETIKPEIGKIKKEEQVEGGRFYSPLVLNIAGKEGISMQELEQIPGSGIGSRVSKKDVLNYLKERKTITKMEKEPEAVPVIKPKIQPIDAGELTQKYPPPKYEIIQMSNVIQKMAEHMVRSVATSPHVQAISQCDMTNIVNYRDNHKDVFEQQEGFKLTYTPFIAEAVVKAIKDFPLVNSSIEGDKIIIKKFINIGMAVASEQGLIVPVIKNADENNFTGLARSINDLAIRTREKKLVPADIEGATITITNYGVFGNIIGIPIIAQPNVAILGIGAIKKQPVVVDDAIAIRSISYLTLSFDHRIIDGALGGMFLERVIKYLEEFQEIK